MSRVTDEQVEQALDAIVPGWRYEGAHLCDLTPDVMRRALEAVLKPAVEPEDPELESIVQAVLVMRPKLEADGETIRETCRAARLALVEMLADQRHLINHRMDLVGAIHAAWTKPDPYGDRPPSLCIAEGFAALASRLRRRDP